MKKVLVILAGAVPLLLRAITGPCDWVTVNTNAVKKWQTEQSASGVKVDTSRREVTVLLEATGLDEFSVAEFSIIGPLSDRAYEAMFVTVASVDAVARAIESVGIPQGKPVDSSRQEFYPFGAKVSILLRRVADGKEFRLSDIYKDNSPEDGEVLDGGIVYTGGGRMADGSLCAVTNIPCAVFANYGCLQSMLQFAPLLNQDEVYGRFTVKKTFAYGELFEAVIKWDGKFDAVEWRVKVRKDGSLAVSDKERQLFEGDFLAGAEFMRAEAKKGKDVFLKVEFDEMASLSTVRKSAEFFGMIDGNGVKVNGCAENQFYYKTFTPNPVWRDRTKRMAQPFEIAVDSAGARTFTFVDEDWSGDGIDPVLKPLTDKFNTWDELPRLIAGTGKKGSKMKVAFIYLPLDASVRAAFEVRKALVPQIDTFYVFPLEEGVRSE